MADLFMFQKLAAMRLEHRCIEMPLGVRYFDMKDGSGHVRLTSSQWDELGRQFAEEIAPSGKRLLAAIFLAVPFAIALIAFILANPVLEAAAHALDRLIPSSVYLLTSLGLPVTAGALHALSVQRAVDRTRQRLAARPRCQAPAAPGRRTVNTLELVLLMLFGPGVFVQLYGTIDPDSLRNTPFSGSHLGPLGTIALITYAALVFLRWQSGRQTLAQEQQLVELTAREPRRRSFDVLSRARAGSTDLPPYADCSDGTPIR